MRELYQFYMYDSISQRESLPEGISLTVESAGALLQSCAQELLGLGTWSDQQNILELGISSFDVVRLANHLEEKLKQFTNPSSGGTFDVTRLVEYLLDQPLTQVAAYVCSAPCDDPNMGSQLLVSSDGGIKNEEGYASASAQKRALIGLSDESLPKKLCKMESGIKMVDFSREIRSFRRGQTFINGR